MSDASHRLAVLPDADQRCQSSISGSPKFETDDVIGNAIKHAKLPNGSAGIAPAVESRDHYNHVYVSGTIGEC